MIRTGNSMKPNDFLELMFPWFPVQRKGLEHVSRVRPRQTRHKVFLSYYHIDDEPHRNLFETMYGHLFISKSVRPGEYDTDLKAPYVKRLIMEEKITDTSVVVVLVGPNTRQRKHVDWEIAAALNKKVHGYSGLLGIILPSLCGLSPWNPLAPTYRPEDLPPRLAANVISGYAELVSWFGSADQENQMEAAIDRAFKKRITHQHLIRNADPMFKRNR